MRAAVIEHACAGCGEPVHGELATVLNAARFPEFRSQILDDSLHRVACTACGRACRIELPLLYLDLPRGQWIACHPSGEEPEWRSHARTLEDRFNRTMIDLAAPIVRDMAAGLRRRLVFGHAALREKLIADDHGIDDRDLEVLKVDLFAQTRLPLSSESRPRLAAVVDGALQLEIRRPTGTIRIELPRRRLDDIATADRSRARDAVQHPPYVDVACLWA